MDITKVSNLILYMLDQNVLHINDKKLSILLFLIDHEAVQKTSSKIFGDEYIKTARHPEPKSLTEIFEVIANDEDLEDGDYKLDMIQELLAFVEIEITQKQSFIELKFLPYEEEFDRSIFTKDEMKIIETIVKKYKDTSPRNIANDCFKIEKVRATPKGQVIF